MIYSIMKPLANISSIANLFHYITFRTMLSVLFSAAFTISAMPYFIALLRKIGGQPIRSDLNLASNNSKKNIPTMGGIVVLLSILTTSLLLGDLSNSYLWCILFCMIGFGVIGFLDDYLKLSKKNHHGLRPRYKFVGQIVVSLIAMIWTYMTCDSGKESILVIPFLKECFINLWYFYIPFGMFVMIGASNAVNLTDGMDGLAIVPIGIVAGCFMIISYVVGGVNLSEYLHIMHINGTSEISILCAAMIGSSLGFLWYNCQPAEIFMGDVGSLALGGMLGIISVITKHEIVLAIAGAIFVIETLSVIMQVYYFKKTKGKRIFLMAPIHHHFEKTGLPESKVVIRFWIFSILSAIIALSSLKIS